MILIESVKVKEVEGDSYNLMLQLEKPIMVEPAKPSEIDAFLEFERVESVLFRNSMGQEIYIGATKEVQKILGLHFDGFENMLKTIDSLSSDKHSLRRKLKKYEKMGVWDRLKFLFIKGGK